MPGEINFLFRFVVTVALVLALIAAAAMVDAFLREPRAPKQQTTSFIDYKEQEIVTKCAYGHPVRITVFHQSGGGGSGFSDGHPGENGEGSRGGRGGKGGAAFATGGGYAVGGDGGKGGDGK